MQQEIEEQDSLGVLNSSEDYEAMIIFEDQVKVQNYIMDKIKSEDANLFVEGVEYSQKELFPSIDTAFKNQEKAVGRNIIEEANKSHHQKQKQLYNQPINAYFYQQSAKTNHEYNQVWSNYITPEYVKFSVI